MNNYDPDLEPMFEVWKQLNLYIYHSLTDIEMHEENIGFFEQRMEEVSPHRADDNQKLRWL